MIGELEDWFRPLLVDLDVNETSYVAQLLSLGSSGWNFWFGRLSEARAKVAGLFDISAEALMDDRNARAFLEGQARIDDATKSPESLTPKRISGCITT